MSGYWLGWALALAAAGGGAFCLFRACSAWATLRWLAALLALTWMMLPWRFQADPERFAPAFVVAGFRWLFEAGADPGPPARALLVATAATLAIFLAAVAARSVFRAGRARMSSMR